MNLVQINERLKDLPMQVLQQYANGMNPEVPPYLALGELQRREMSQKQMATAQGGQQGPQPSVKEQVEQKAGLIALQQMQQQQVAQQMQQPRGPMPAPAGVPQPQMQPQPQQAMMARGGLAGIPVPRDMFEYAGGGIIAFQSGGQSLNERAARQMEEKGSIYDPFFGLPAEERERMKQEAKLKAAQERSGQGMAVTESNAQALAEGAQARVNELESNREALIRQYGARQYEQALAKAKQAITAASSRGSELLAQQSQRGQSMVSEATPAPRPAAPISRPNTQMTPQQMEAKMTSGIPDALKNIAPPKAIAPPAVGPAAPAATPQPGLPAALAGAPAAAAIPVSPDRAELDALMKAQQRPAPTAQGVISDVNALMPAGMQEGARNKLLADQRARVDARQAAYDKSKPSGLDDLIRVFGQAGQYKGLSGLAPAETAMQQQRRSEDLAMQKQQDELLTAIEGRGTAFDKDVFTARTGAMGEAQKMFGQSQKSILEAAAAKLGAEQGRLDKQAQLNMQRDLEEFKAIQDKELKKMDIQQRERESKRTDARSPAARASEYVALKQKARDLRAKGEATQADRLDAQAEDMKGFSGASGAGEENAATRSLRTALEAVNKRLELMGPDEPDYAAVKKQQKDISDQLVGRALGTKSGGTPSGEVDKTNPLLK